VSRDITAIEISGSHGDEYEDAVFWNAELTDPLSSPQRIHE
jgi:hypothetical protein